MLRSVSLKIDFKAIWPHMAIPKVWELNIGQKLTLLNNVWDRWLLGKFADPRLQCVVGSIENSSWMGSVWMGGVVQLDLRIDRYFN